MTIWYNRNVILCDGYRLLSDDYIAEEIKKVIEFGNRNDIGSLGAIIWHSIH